MHVLIVERASIFVRPRFKQISCDKALKHLRLAEKSSHWLRNGGFYHDFSVSNLGALNSIVVVHEIIIRVEI